MRSATCIDLTRLLLAEKVAQNRRRKRLSVCLWLAVIFSALLITGLARAQDEPQEAPEVEEPVELPEDPCEELRSAVPEDAPEPVRASRAGVIGMWFPMPTARLILCEVRELRLRHRDARLVARELRLHVQQEAFLGEQVRLAVEARNELEEVVDDAERRAREAREDLDAWHRSPALWFAVGVVAAVAVGIATAYGLSAVSD